MDASNFAFVNHTVDVSPLAPGGQIGYVFPQEEHDGVFDDWAVAETDNVQGWFQVEVVYPTYRLSNIDGYNMDCYGPITGGKTY